MSLNDVSFINNHGVMLLRKGSLSEAAEVLRKALDGSQERLHDEIRTTSSETLYTMGAVRSPLTRLKHCIYDSFSVQVGLPATWLEKAEQEEIMVNTRRRQAQDVSTPEQQQSQEAMYQQQGVMDGDMIFIHSQGICLIPGNALAYSVNPMFNRSAIYAVVLYNLGVVNHVQSLLGRRGSPFSTYQSKVGQERRAKGLYAMARSIIQDAGIDIERPSGNTVLDFLAMALWNNSGFLAFCEGHFAEVRLCFASLQLFMLACHTIGSHRSWDEDTVDCMGQHRDDFHINAKILIRPPSCAVAA